MGGADSEVTDKTTRVLLECAASSRPAIRARRKRHALHTEASHRFERGVDCEGARWCSTAPRALIAELAGGQVLQGRVDVYPKPVAPREIALRLARVGKVLGAEIPDGEIERILTALGFRAGAKQGGVVTYRVPTFRPDVEREEDPIEEVARIRGFENPERAPQQRPAAQVRPGGIEAERRARAALAGAGFDEVVNYSFVSPKISLARCGRWRTRRRSGRSRSRTRSRSSSR